MQLLYYMYATSTWSRLALCRRVQQIDECWNSAQHVQLVYIVLFYLVLPADCFASSDKICMLTQDLGDQSLRRKAHTPETPQEGQTVE